MFYGIFRFIVECILEELMVVLPDLFAEITDADNEHLPANSVCFIYLNYLLKRDSLKTQVEGNHRIKRQMKGLSWQRA